MDIRHHVRDDEHMAGGEALAVREPIGIGDEVPKTGIAPDFLRDRLQAVTWLHRVAARRQLGDGVDDASS